VPETPLLRHTTRKKRRTVKAPGCAPGNDTEKPFPELQKALLTSA